MKGTTSRERAGERPGHLEANNEARSKTGTDNEAQALAFKPKKEAIIPHKQKDIALQFRY